jgi:hypothetical protein
MKLRGLAVVFAVAVLSAIPSVPAPAQQKPGKVTVITELAPKPGAEKQFEDGLKQLVRQRRKSIRVEWESFHVTEEIQSRGERQ